MKSYDFSSITYQDIESLIDLEEVVDDSKFEHWLRPKQADPDLKSLFQSLIDRNRKNLESYSEEEIKIKLLVPLLQRINFPEAGIEEWYERTFRGRIGNAEVGGVVDCVLAKGEKAPIHPIFFLQELKPSFTNKNPEVQLVSELIVALGMSDRKLMHGAYLVGAIFNFVVLELFEASRYVYSVSESLDAMKMSDLERIYAALSWIKE